MDISNPSQPKGKRAGLRGRNESPVRVAHWVSISARDDAKPFGTSRGGETVLNARGKALAASWRELGDLRAEVEPDALVIGPRRLQGILLFPRKNTEGATLAEVIRLFKVLSSLRLAHLAKTAAIRNVPATSRRAPAKSASALWKKGFVEKPISGSAGLAEARKALKGLQAR
jgi:hypothetical protein